MLGRVVRATGCKEWREGHVIGPLLPTRAVFGHSGPRESLAGHRGPCESFGVQAQREACAGAERIRKGRFQGGCLRLTNRKGRLQSTRCKSGICSCQAQCATHGREYEVVDGRRLGAGEATDVRGA